jgi:hypothetical protein
MDSNVTPILFLSTSSPLAGQYQIIPERCVPVRLFWDYSLKLYDYFLFIANNKKFLFQFCLYTNKAIKRVEEIKKEYPESSPFISLNSFRDGF